MYLAITAILTKFVHLKEYLFLSYLLLITFSPCVTTLLCIYIRTFVYCKTADENVPLSWWKPCLLRKEKKMLTYLHILLYTLLQTWIDFCNFLCYCTKDRVLLHIVTYCKYLDHNNLLLFLHVSNVNIMYYHIKACRIFHVL